MIHLWGHNPDNFLRTESRTFLSIQNIIMGWLWVPIQWILGGPFLYDSFTTALFLMMDVVFMFVSGCYTPQFVPGFSEAPNSIITFWKGCVFEEDQAQLQAKFSANVHPSISSLFLEDRIASRTRLTFIIIFGSPRHGHPWRLVTLVGNNRKGRNCFFLKENWETV